MGWGIWKKIKQGISKIGAFGKKIINKVVENAPKIINMKIPSSVSSFGNNVFESCSSLERISFEGSTCSIGDESFKEFYDLGLVVYREP